jgi:hypothetical protein
MGRRSEGAARHVDQESRSGPDPDSRHAGQDRVKRVSKHEPLNFLRHFIALDAQSRQLLRQARQDDAGSLGAQDHCGLLRQHLEDFGGPGLTHARSEFDEPVGQLLLAERGELRRRRVALEQIRLDIRSASAIWRRPRVVETAGRSNLLGVSPW